MYHSNVETLGETQAGEGSMGTLRTIFEMFL